MWAILSVFTTMACALLLSLGTRSFNEVGSARWTEPGILHVLLVFAFIAAMSGFHIVLTTATNGVVAPFVGATALLISSFIGLAMTHGRWHAPTLWRRAWRISGSRAACDSICS
jgi:cytochrome bd ubiquinol oxidase subunit II